MEGVNQFKDFTLTWFSDAAATFLIYTDLPGGTMAQRRTINLPASGGDRRTVTFPLDLLIDGGLLEGKLIKFRAQPTGKLILYEGSVRFRRVGTYIDGANGEVWETQPLGLGA